MSTDDTTPDARPQTPSPDRRVLGVHRVGAVVVALVITAFGILGLVGGLGFFDTRGAPVLGLSSNGLLSTISLVTAAILVGAAVRGGRLASTVMMVIGVLFLVSAFANLAVLRTSVNVLAFRLPNVFFSLGAGLVLLLLGAYGRLSAGLPTDNPYRLERVELIGADGEGHDLQEPVQPRPSSDAEHRADEEMAQAARAVAQGVADPGQRRRLAAVEGLRTHEERRASWMRGADDAAPT